MYKGVLIMKEEIMSLLKDYGELTLDMFLRDGIIKELPIVGSTFSMIKISADIRDRIFLENVHQIHQYPTAFLNKDKMILKSYLQ